MAVDDDVDETVLDDIIGDVVVTKEALDDVNTDALEETGHVEWDNLEDELSKVLKSFILVVALNVVVNDVFVNMDVLDVVDGETSVGIDDDIADVVGWLDNEIEDTSSVVPGVVDCVDTEVMYAVDDAIGETDCVKSADAVKFLLDNVDNTVIDDLVVNCSALDNVEDKALTGVLRIVLKDEDEDEDNGLDAGYVEPP